MSGSSGRRVLVVLNVADSQCVPYELAARMARRGVWDVSIVAFREREGAFPHEQFGVPVEVLGGRGPLKLGAALRLWRRLRRERPDVVHVHVPVSSVWGTLLGRAAGSRVVKTEHNDVTSYRLTKRIVNAAMYLLTARVIGNSQSTLDSFGPIERGTTARRSTFIYNGVDFGLADDAAGVRAEARRELGLRDDEIAIGSVARFVEQKNLVRLVRAFARVRAEVARPLRLVLVGAGRLRGELEQAARAAKVEDAVLFTGALERKRVFRTLAALDVYAVPSLWEGFCNAAVEAAGSGLPILAADIPTLREVLGTHARFADPADETAIARELRALIETPDAERRALGASARAFVRERYGIERASERYEAELGRIANGRHAV